MDGLDASILRTWLWNGEWSPEGVDPCLAPTQLARALNVAPSTIGRRLADWEADGFLGGLSIIPNPALAGLEFHFQVIAAPDLAASKRVDEELQLLEGACLAHRIGGGYGIVSIFPDARSRYRDGARLRRIPGVHVLTEPIPFSPPAPTYRMHRRDWELLDLLRQNPAVGVRRASSYLGVAARSWKRRLTAWVKGRAVFFVPRLDFERSRGSVAWVGVIYEPSRESWVRAAIARQWPRSVPVRSLFPLQCLTPEGVVNPLLPSLQLLVPSRTAQTGEAEFVRFSQTAGVVRALSGLPGRNWDLPAAIDRFVSSAPGDLSLRAGQTSTPTSPRSVQVPVSAVSANGEGSRFAPGKGDPRNWNRPGPAPLPRQVMAPGLSTSGGFPPSEAAPNPPGNARSPGPGRTARTVPRR